MNKKFDVKLRLIVCEISNSVLRTESAIVSCIRGWDKKYQEKGKLELKRLCALRDRLYKASWRLTESEINNLIKLMEFRVSGQFELAKSIAESDDLQLKQIAGVVCDSNFYKKILPNAVWRCYERYYNYKHSGFFWQQRRREILLQRGKKCEQCGSTEKIHVHHKKGREDILDEDLEVLCQKCHITRHPELYGKR